MIKHKKKIVLFSAVIFGFSLLVNPAYAQLASGAPTTYNVTVNKVELCTSAACASPVVLGSGASSFDIASASVGAELGSYASLDSVPKGITFTHIRTTLSRTISIAGSTADPGNVGGTCGTNNADGSSNATTAGVGTVGGGGTAQNLVVPDELAFAGGTQPPAGTYAANDLTLLNATEMQFLQALPSPFTMEDVPPTIDLSFETATGLQSFDSNGGVAGGNCSMIPGAPVVNLSVK